MIEGVEWRFVATRPEGQEGRDLIVAIRDAKRAREALDGWKRDMEERYKPNGLAVWSAHIETREVGQWREVTDADLGHDRIEAQ